MTTLEDLDAIWPPMQYMGNINDPAFRAEHGLRFGFISEDVAEDRARLIADDDFARLVFRSAFQRVEWSSNRAFGFGIPDQMDDGYSDDTDSDIDPDESPTERFNRRQIERAIANSLSPEFDPEYNDPADRASVQAMPVKTLECDSELDCVICMEPMKTGNEYMEFPCHGDSMHAGCSRRWFETGRTCPTCKLELFPPAAA